MRAVTRRMGGMLALAALAWAACAAQDGVAPFSGAQPSGALPGAWREQPVPKASPAQVRLVRDGEATVLEVRAAAAAGGAIHPLRIEPASRPVLAWRWKVDGVVERADMRVKAGDDFAARLYVFFDVPAAELPFGAWAKIRVAKLLYGAELPTAALCYVWDNRQPEGTTRWNPYTDRVRMVVLRSGGARAGEWVEERRDLEADFRAAFGGEGPVPAVTGVAVSVDTDQTGETVTARFGDLRLEGRP